MSGVRVSNRHLIEWMERNGWSRRKASGVLWTYRYNDNGRNIDVRVAAPHSSAKTDSETLRDILRVSGVNRAALLASSGFLTEDVAVEQAITEVEKVGFDYIHESVQDDRAEALAAAQAVEQVAGGDAEEETVEQSQTGPVPYRSRRVSRPLRNALHAARLLFADGVLTFTAGQLLAVHPDADNTTETALRALFNHNPEFVTVGRGRYQLNQKVARTIVEPLRTPKPGEVPLAVANEAWEIALEMVQERSAEGKITDPGHIMDLLDLDRKQARNLLYRMAVSGVITNHGHARYTLPGVEPVQEAVEAPQEAPEATPEPPPAPEPTPAPPEPEPEPEPVKPEEVQPTVSPAPKPTPEQMSSDPYELVDELLDLMLPNGFKAKHFTKVANWRETTLALLKEVGE